MGKGPFKGFNKAPVFQKQARSPVKGELADEVFRKLLDDAGNISFLQDALGQLLQGQAADNPAYQLPEQLCGTAASPDFGRGFFQGSSTIAARSESEIWLPFSSIKP